MKASQVADGRRARVKAIGIVALGVGIGIALAFVIRSSTPEDVHGYRPATALKEGDELVLVYVGSSGCSWSNKPELVETVHDLKRMLSNRADSIGLGFAAVGVARDVSSTRGLEHLRKFGPFDEVMSGRGWLNIGVQKYVYGDMPGPGATPQLILLARSLNYDTGHIGIASERVLARKVGFDMIEEWTAAGAPGAYVSPTGPHSETDR